MALSTTNEVAEYLNVHRITVIRMANDGRIPVIKLSSKEYRYQLDEVLAALKEGSTDAE